jgi:hypothetical protein
MPAKPVWPARDRKDGSIGTFQPTNEAGSSDSRSLSAAMAFHRVAFPRRQRGRTPEPFRIAIRLAQAVNECASFGD